MEGKIEAILIDIDDCSLPTDGKVSSEFYQGLEQISQLVKKANQGMSPVIGFCTGRDRNYVEAFSFSVGRPNSWSVIESGIALFNPTTKEMLLNPALTPEIKKAFEDISRKRIPQILEKYPGLFLYPGNIINVAIERQYGFDLPIEECYQIVKEEVEDLLGLSLITITHSRIAVDISPAGIDKASGVRFLSQQTGINLAQTIGVGDSRGDFPMLELVGRVGCPNNASEDCKKFVRNKKGYISSLNHAHGVADVIRYFLGEG